ncbi:WD repeat protein [Aspergillus stella-maris]|uniref:WD repeat protein n=1 Tax=Aspergillus stella-maris TaxID=1810926 RepID=UPI003CCCAD60
MPAKEQPSPARLAKRSRASDAALDNTQVKKERTKRRRTSAGEDHAGNGNSKTQNSSEVSQKSIAYDTPGTSIQLALSAIDQGANSPSSPWSITRNLAGQFSDIDPVLTPDEQYIILGLDTAIHIYSIATSRIFRVLEVGPGGSIIGYRLSNVNHERLYIFTLSGSVSEWDWSSNKQLAHWTTTHKTISADLVCRPCTSGEADARNILFSLQERKDGKRFLSTTSLNGEKLESTVVLDTNIKIDGFRVLDSGQAIVAFGGARIFFGGLSSNHDADTPIYSWREIKLATTITCIDIRASLRDQSVSRKVPDFDIALGGTDGSVLVYHDASSFLDTRSGRGEDKKPSPRRLHWHRNPVTAVRWSTDGNYVLSGGHESVMVLWQLDTGRKQFLPHLSSPICNIVVSGTGNSYAVKLADNRAVVLSARELQPLATIISLQLCAKSGKSAGQSCARGGYSSGEVTAILHPQNPDQLLITVPSAHSLTKDGATSPSAPVLQIYDIHSGSHISRQALARTNATTLNISPDGTRILTPDVQHLSVSDDGNWMATVDTWSPYSDDVAALDLNSCAGSARQETYLKFWRWNEPSALWQLITRIDSPHLLDNINSPVLDIASRPNSQEFATIGTDGLLRLWRPIVRQRRFLTKEENQTPETWKCRNTLDLKGHYKTCDASSARLESASVCFSGDGSVLAASLQPTTTSPGLSILIDVRTCSVKYRKVGVSIGHISATSFLGCNLLIATERSVSIWDAVNDTVRLTDSIGPQSDGDSGPCLLAVNPRTQTFAVASRNLQKKHTSKKSRRSGYMVRVYDIGSIALLARFKLAKEPVKLLSSTRTAEYVVVDSGANVLQVGCANKIPRTNNTGELVQYPDSGLEGLFGHQTTGTKVDQSTSAIVAGSNAQPWERNGLAGVFGDTPPFVLPPSRTIFRDLVKALSA